MAPNMVEIVTIVAIVLISLIFAVYLLILKKNGWLGETSDFYRCPNQVCKRIFQKPIELKDLSEIPARLYLACPECGTDLESFFGSHIEKTSRNRLKTPLHQKNPSLESSRKKVEQLKSVIARPSQNQNQELKKMKSIGHPTAVKEDADTNNHSNCQYYLGYLASREKGEIIPNQCLECYRSLDCMLYHNNSEDTVSEIKKWYPIKA